MVYPSLVDRCVETWQGVFDQRVHGQNIQLIALSDAEAVHMMRWLSRYLRVVVQSHIREHSDLVTIRDEVLAHTYQLLYRFTLE